MQHSNISGNNHNYKFPFSTFSQKWTRREDDKLRKAVQKYGTQWTFIAKRFRFNRSINSLVKRWHGKLKEEIQNGVPEKNQESQSEQEVQQVVDKSKRTRKEEKREQKKQQKRQDRREQKKQEKKEQVKDLIRQIRDTSRTRRQRISMSSRQKQENNKVIKRQLKIDNQENEKDQGDQIDSMSEMEQDQYVFQHNWKETEDYMLKESILTEKILNWQELASKLRISDIKEVKKRWQKKIYPSIVDSRKIGGCVKYSEEQDSILTRGVKLGLGINELRRFLPGRTPYSLDARRRRTLRMQEKQIPELRFWTKRLSLYKFVQKRHQHLQKPAEEQFFLYKSDSE